MAETFLPLTAMSDRDRRIKQLEDGVTCLQVKLAALEAPSTTSTSIARPANSPLDESSETPTLTDTDARLDTLADRFRVELEDLLAESLNDIDGQIADLHKSLERKIDDNRKALMGALKDLNTERLPRPGKTAALVSQAETAPGNTGTSTEEKKKGSWGDMVGYGYSGGYGASGFVGQARYGGGACGHPEGPGGKSWW